MPASEGVAVTSRLAAERQLEGVELPHDDPIRCSNCHARLTEGQPITAAAGRSEGVWRYGDIWCAGCAPLPRDGSDGDVLAEGTLAVVSDVRRQRHYSVVIDVVVAAGRPDANCRVLRGP